MISYLILLDDTNSNSRTIVLEIHKNSIKGKSYVFKLSRYDFLAFNDYNVLRLPVLRFYILLKLIFKYFKSPILPKSKFNNISYYTV